MRSGWEKLKRRLLRHTWVRSVGMKLGVVQPPPKKAGARGTQAKRQQQQSAKRTSRRKSPNAAFPGSEGFWEARYAAGGDSGRGSRGVLAQYKAQWVGDFISAHHIETVTELGCGDGVQVSLGRYPRYIGLDVSATAVRACVQRFAGDPTKSFMVYASGAVSDPDGFLKSELSLSLDVLFHLVEDEVFEWYMHDLFSMGSRFVVIYASDSRPSGGRPSVVNRSFTQWIDKHLPDWQLVEHVDNPHAWNGDPNTSTHSEFYVYAPVDRGHLS